MTAAGILKNETHLRLALAAHGFWQDRKNYQYGFSFYSKPHGCYYHVTVDETPHISGINIYFVSYVHGFEQSVVYLYNYWIDTCLTNAFLRHTGCSLKLWS